MGAALAWRIAVLALLLGGVVASDSVAAEAGSSKGTRFEILYTSDWEGPTQIFAVDPLARAPVGQVTHVPPFAYAPVPSPDGRHLLYTTAQGTECRSTLWLSLADGSAARQITTGLDRSFGEPVWSPDSSRFAYLAGSCLGDSLHVASANGSRDRIVGLSPNGHYDVEIVWSADSRHVKAAPIAYGASRSPDGRWKVIRSVLYHADGALAWVFSIDSAIIEVAWSPDSRYLAYVNIDKGADQGTHVLDTRTKKTRLLTRDVGCFLAWSPDGRLLAYLQGTHYNYLHQTDCASVGDLRTVTPDGKVRVVVAAGGPYAPWRSFAWTQVPKGVSYQTPSRVTGVYASSPVTALAVDGGRVAYATCAGVFIWGSTAARATEVASSLISDNCVETHEDISSVALAGDRLAYVDAYGGNTTVWSVHAVSLGTMPYASSVLANGDNTSGLPFPEVAGSGGLLAFATREPKRVASTSVLVWQIQTVGPGGCPCQEISSFEQPSPDRFFHLDDVNAGRVLVNGGGLVRVLGSDGSELLDLPLEASEAALSGDDLVVHTEGELRDYDASTGTLLHAWALAPTPQAYPSVLQDVAHGLAAYVVDGELHVLRLSDGSDTVIGPGSLARFTDTGLVEAAGPRVQLIPLQQASAAVNQHRRATAPGDIPGRWRT